MSSSATKVLFVCMGNICRSPAAECFFREALENGKSASLFEIKSAGTGGWHVGAKPDRRMRAAAKKQGLIIEGSARQVAVEDFSKFDWIFCMDSIKHGNFLSTRTAPCCKEREYDRTFISF